MMRQLTIRQIVEDPFRRPEPVLDIEMPNNADDLETDPRKPEDEEDLRPTEASRPYNLAGLPRRLEAAQEAVEVLQPLRRRLTKRNRSPESGSFPSAVRTSPYRPL
jgi:hypothetical protein